MKELPGIIILFADCLISRITQQDSFITKGNIIMTFSRTRSLILAALLVLFATVCQAASGLPPFDAKAAPSAPDYAQQTGWISLPSNPGQFAVDIFWVYPTILADDSGWLMDKDNPDLQALAQNTIPRQAAVFSGQANLYAPYYRQMNMAALSLSDTERATLVAYGKDDVRRALDYYLKHHNNGRPFILAGHSQGSNLLVDLAVELWGTLGVENRLVAAYTIGWSITKEELAKNSALTMCTDAAQTGCFISYNTVAAGRQSVAPTIRKGAVVTNPLTWKTDGAKGAASMNLGSTFFNPHLESETVPKFTSAQVVGDGLVVVPADEALVDMGDSGFPAGVYHVYDYSLFFENLRSNAAQRIQAFLTKDK